MTPLAALLPAPWAHEGTPSPLLCSGQPVSLPSCFPSHWSSFSPGSTEAAMAAVGGQHLAARLHVPVVPVYQFRKGIGSLFPSTPWTHAWPWRKTTQPNDCAVTQETHSGCLSLKRKKYQCWKGCVAEPKPKMLICNCKKEFGEVSS